eukprot:364387-Chlamydomonas_euryale.AAC.8
MGYGIWVALSNHVPDALLHDHLVAPSMYVVHHMVCRNEAIRYQGTGDARPRRCDDTSSELMRPKGDRHASGCALHATSRRGSDAQLSRLSLI